NARTRLSALQSDPRWNFRSRRDKLRVMNQSFKHQHENTKHQVPNTKEFRSSKSQFCPRRRRLGACDLKFFWSLELGVWCLDFDVWDFVLGPVGPPDSLTRHRAVADLHCHQKSGPTLS